MEQKPHTEAPVASAAQWRALSHPLRLGILRLLAAGTMTNEELAHALGVASGKLHFHTKTLLQAGLITPAGTRRKGAITEKLYQATAHRFVASPASGSEAPPLADAVAAGLALYRSSWQADPDLTQLGYHLVLSISPSRTQEFLDRLRQLAEEFSQAGSHAPEARPVALTALMHTLPFLESAGGDTP